MFSVSSQKVKDKLCQRAIERIKKNLTKSTNVSRDQSGGMEERGVSANTQENGKTLSANTIQNEEGNSGEV